MLYNALHQVWRRLLPRDARRAALFALSARLAPRPDHAARLRPGPVTVAGQLTTASGLGEGARLQWRALADMGCEVRAADISPAFNQVDMPPDPAFIPPLAGEGGTLIAHVNGPFLPFALWRLGRGVVRGRRVIGYWAWELPQLPADWRHGFPFVHEVWTPSRFTADAVSAAMGRPARVVPHPMAPPAPSPFERGYFGLPADAFIAMTFFDMGSSFVRKNPAAAVRAFRAAFGDDPRRVLLVKVSGGEKSPDAWKQLQDVVGGAPNIRVIDRKLPRAEVDSLLDIADAVLSLHRAEGFGLIPAEAMARGRPVIATGWSGNMDFMTTDNSLPISYRLIPAIDPQRTYDFPGQSWADPDVGEAAAALRRLADDPALGRRLGLRGAADIQAGFGPDAYRAILGKALATGPRLL